MNKLGPSEIKDLFVNKSVIATYGNYSKYKIS